MDMWRRKILGVASGIVLGTILPKGLLATTRISEEPYADADAVDTWMQGIDGFGAAGGTLHLGRFADRMYYTFKPIGWSPNAGQVGPAAVDVPEGFVTDLTSIPRVFWSMLPSDGNYAYSAIIHDYLYWEQKIPREDADQVFALSMEDFDISAATINIIHTAVRKLGGQRAWDRNAALKASGEKRVMKKFPSDATIRWDEWKKEKGVFG